jgi:hypothetical protein
MLRGLFRHPVLRASVRGVCPDCVGDAPDHLTVKADAVVLITLLRFIVRRALVRARRWAPAIGAAGPLYVLFSARAATRGRRRRGG